MNVKRIFWKFWLGNKSWCGDMFALHWVSDQISGIDYAGVTIFGYSILYSDYF